ncbi:electron transfer flavoprotein subunit alpha/FixB family protein [Hymenobacter negativus]|uniref:Electron transfer flavoprotein subunit alpha/FixB family protein n=1 Tax=Hymenobacter negativus TaxID=2795026 RepID=A0ABS0Q222_9BACT|nr:MULTISPECIES: electron transfer flavoprotein subunit alpha/FixB family protein [Bacteria]MBH8556693.1 electron transfer flavoprotein subunit alpha/FixB family protein [Hymenobacter negativus]MBH8571217.1 electron transfer flavoprotein subunit alpha/FixB family protein [Hymenobacter negativus]MBR7210954.1 electron transfer flavoprotein subunit alpha/FixB family protein [Microvirga sp. STS02]
MSVLVVVECADGEVKKSSLEVASYGAQVAAQLGTTATAIAVGEANEANLAKLGEQGITKVLFDAEPRLKDFVNNAYTKLIATAAEQEQAKIIVLANSNIGAAVGSRLSVRLKASLATNVVELPKTDGGQFTVKRGAFSGKAFSDVVLSGDRKIIAVKKNSTEAKHDAGKTAEVTSFAAQLSDADFADAPTQVVMQDQAGGILLPEAELVVSGGRGMKGPENWNLIEDLAKALGAATACSKPVSDVDWRPHHEHVGQTGITISPNLYIACGISGAIQHLAGVNSSKVIVVINKDPEAPFFKAADYGIVGDVFDVLPKLTAAVKALN